MVCTLRRDRRASIGGLLTCSLVARASQFIGKPLSFAWRGSLEGKGCREQDVKVCTWWIEASLIARIIDPIRVHIRAHKQKAYKKGWLCYLLSKIVFLPNNTLPSIYLREHQHAYNIYRYPPSIIFRDLNPIYIIESWCKHVCQCCLSSLYVSPAQTQTNTTSSICCIMHAPSSI